MKLRLTELRRWLGHRLLPSVVLRLQLRGAGIGVVRTVLLGWLLRVWGVRVHRHDRAGTLKGRKPLSQTVRGFPCLARPERFGLRTTAFLLG